MLGYDSARQADPSLQAPTEQPPEQYEQTEGNAALLEQIGIGTGAGIPPIGAPGPLESPSWAEDLEQPDLSAVPGFVHGEGGGEAPADAGSAVPPAVVAFVDSILTPGLGVSLSAEGSATIVLKLGVSGSVQVTNVGGGWLEVTVEGGGTLGASSGLGAEASQAEAKADLTLEDSLSGTRTFRVPWTRTLDPIVAAEIAGSALGAAVDVVRFTPGDLAEKLIGDTDLHPYLMSEEFAIGQQVSGSAGVSAIGEELGVEIGGGWSGTYAKAYDDVADEQGVRTGTIRLEGTVEGFGSIAADLDQTFGYDISPHLQQSGSLAFVVPFTETAGDADFGMPWVEATPLSGELLDGGVSATVGIGPEHQEITLEASSTAGEAMFEDVVAKVTPWVELLSTGMAELDTTSTVTASLTVDLSSVDVPDPAAVAEQVTRFVQTGAVPDELSELAGSLTAAVQQGEVSIAADLALTLTAEASSAVTVGAEVGVDLGGAAALTYQRDDLQEEMAPPPTASDVLAVLRGTKPLPE